MTSPVLNFTSTDNALAYKLYKGLTTLGVSLSDMDVGEGTINYTGSTCPTGTSTCLVGAHDGKVTSSEVFEYALNNYEKYQKLIEGTIGSPLPWVLDDLDPATTFDADVRAKVQAAIDKLKFTLTTAQGLQEGSEEYEEDLALGIFYLAMVPDKVRIQNPQYFAFDELTTELENHKMGWFREYLRENGGFRAQGEDSEEYTALESIKSGRGKCTEESKKLFAFFKMAGFSPNFVEIPVAEFKTGNPFVNKEPRIRELLNEKLKKLPSGKDHVCIGLQIGGRFRLFDASLVSSDIRFQLFNPLTLRQYLACDLSNRGIKWWDKIEFEKAMVTYSEATQIDPQYPKAYSGLGASWLKKEEFDKARAAYSEVIRITPQDFLGYNNRGIVLYCQGKVDQAIADFSEAIKLNPQFNLEPTLLKLIKLKWQQDSQKGIAALFEAETDGLDISKVEYFFLYSYILWLAGDYPKAKEQLKIIDGVLSFKTPPSDSTKGFFTEMFQLIPTDMAKNPEVQTMVGSIKTKLK